MTLRRPLVLLGKNKTELPVGDTLPALELVNSLNREFVRDETEITTNSTTYIDIFAANFDIDFDGNYRIDVNMSWNSTSSNKRASFRLLIDAVEFGEIVLESNTNSVEVRAVETFLVRAPMLAGSREIKLQMHAQDAAQSVTTFTRNVFLERWI